MKGDLPFPFWCDVFFILGGFNPIEKHSSKSDHLPRDRGKQNTKTKPPIGVLFFCLFLLPWPKQQGDLLFVCWLPYGPKTKAGDHPHALLPPCSSHFLGVRPLLAAARKLSLFLNCKAPEIAMWVV